MEKEIEELKKYLSDVNSFAFPSYRELPGMELYMEQVLRYINSTLSTLTLDQQNRLTSFMVNNYVKAKMIDLPVKKRYGKEQIGYLMAICLLKSTLSMDNLSLLLGLDAEVSPDKSRLYAFWASMENSILSDTSKKTAQKVESISKHYKQVAAKDPAKADQDARASLALVALRLSIQAQADKLVADSIISLLREDMKGEEGEEEKKPTKEERKEQRKSKKEARRLGETKEKSDTPEGKAS